MTKRITIAATTLAFAMLTSCVSPKHGIEPLGADLQQRSGQVLQQQKTPGEIVLPPAISLGDSLSEDEAVAIALWNNAAFQSTLAELGFSNAALIEAGQLTNPSFSILFPTGPKQLEFALKFPLEALWLRRKRINLAETEYQRAAESLVQNGLNLIRDVKLAFAEVLSAETRSALAIESAKVLSQMAGLSDARLRAGDLSELETGLAKTQALAATEDARRLASEITIKKEKLRTLLGLGFSDSPITPTSQATALAAAPEVKELVKFALASRPDLRAAELAMEAAGQRVGLARSEVYHVTGVLDSNGDNPEFEMGPGLDLVIPLFHRDQGRVARERAGLEKAARDYIVVRDQIAFEVREAHAQYSHATQSLEAWRREILPSVQSSVDRATKAYEAGNVSYLFVLEQNRQFVVARTNEAQAEANARVALANLERGIGQRLAFVTQTQTAKKN